MIPRFNKTPRTNDARRDLSEPKAKPLWLIGCITLVLGGLLLLQLMLHGHIGAVDEYDDGVYFASAMNLGHGVLPYKDFAFLQPPVILYLLLPATWFGNHFGTMFGLEVARSFIDLIPLCNVVLVGLVLRTRKTTSLLLGMGVMAFYEGTITSAQTVLIEPALCLFCLIAIVIIFWEQKLTSSMWRLSLGGISFGIAGATKLWAVFPFLIVAVILLRRSVGVSLRFVLATGLGFLIPIAPFLVISPFSFFNQILFTQARRGFSGLTIFGRISSLSSELYIYHWDKVVGVLVAIVVLLTFISLSLKVIKNVGSSNWESIEVFGIGSTLIVGAILAVAPAYYYHYAGFVAPFCAFGIVGLFEYFTNSPLGLDDLQQRRRYRAKSQKVFVGALLAILVIGDFVGIFENPAAPIVPPVAKAAVQSLGCVVSDVPTVMILMNRLTTFTKGCPNVVDWNGQERVVDFGASGVASDASNPAFQKMVLRWFRSATTVVLGGAYPGVGPVAMRYLRANYRSTYNKSLGITIYSKL